MGFISAGSLCLAFGVGEGTGANVGSINKRHLQESRQEMIIAWARRVAMMEMNRSRQM